MFDTTGSFVEALQHRARRPRAAPGGRRSGAGEGPDHAAPALHRKPVCGTRPARLVRCLAALLEGDASRLQARAHGTAAGGGRKDGFRNSRSLSASARRITDTHHRDRRARRVVFLRNSRRTRRTRRLIRTERMGKVTGFIEIQRKKHPTRPVAERVHDWHEVYLPYAQPVLAGQAARCMDCGIPFLPQGLSARQSDSGLERPRLS